MSTKFNRNDSEAVNDQFYLTDYQTDLNGVEEDQRTHTGDFHPTPCILSGLVVSEGTGNTVDVSAGVAYDEDAYRIEVPTDQTGISFTLDGNWYWIVARHKDSTSTARIAYKTGNSWNTRIYDDFEIVVRDSSSWPQTGDVTLAKVRYYNNQVEVDTSDRTQPDFGGDTVTDVPRVTGVSAMTGSEFDLVYNNAGNPIRNQIVADDIPERAYIQIDWTPLDEAVEYEIELIPFDDTDTELWEHLRSIKVTYNHLGSPDVLNRQTVHDLQPGVKWRIRIRAINAAGEKGPYSDPIDIIAGIGDSSQLTMSAISLAAYDTNRGVEVTWNVVSGAKGYELYTTEGSNPPDPDPTDKTQLRYRGNANKVLLQVKNNITLKVVAQCYDRWGRLSSNTTSASITIGTPS